MKNLFLLMFGLLFVLAGCKDDKNDPAPKTASQNVVGLYTANKIKDGADEFPLPITIGGTTLSGTINVEAIANQNSKVDVTITIKQGPTAQSDTYEGVELQAANSGYKMVYQGDNIGTVDGKTVVITEDDVSIFGSK